ncbi:unnamed protein product [Peniophora sp. CBMAI 1063]|nr:unnamed protein product [Peniophora sp. CBMAI 1063]
MAAEDDVISSQPVKHTEDAVSLPYTAPTPNPWSETQPTFRFGVADEKGPRRTMEDAHTYVFDFAGVSGQGFFAVFDGHAGKEAADWCAKNFHEHLLQQLEANPDMHIPDVFNAAFQSVDRHLTKMSNESQGKIHSGCTAVTAFLRIEDADGRQPFSSGLDATAAIVNSHSPFDRPGPASPGSGGLGADSAKGNNNNSPSATPRTQSPTRTTHARSNSVSTGPVQSPPPGPSLKRTLYVANAGDARGVLCRRGRALRLTYDHKGTDKQEAKRIMDSGGFVMSGRVNGVLAVTRSLGDSSMKEFVVGAPYTTETELTDDDEFLILACDGIWDVLDDQMAADIVRPIQNVQEAANKLIQEATTRYTNDNITCMVIRLKDVTSDQ